MILGCGPKRKKRYRTRRIALMTANRAMKDDKAPSLYVYKCPNCRWWHLTHQEQRA